MVKSHRKEARPHPQKKKPTTSSTLEPHDGKENVVRPQQQLVVRVKRRRLEDPAEVICVLDDTSLRGFV